MKGQVISQLGDWSVAARAVRTWDNFGKDYLG